MNELKQSLDKHDENVEPDGSTLVVQQAQAQVLGSWRRKWSHHYASNRCSSSRQRHE